MPAISNVDESTAERDTCGAMDLVDPFSSPRCLDEDLPDFDDEERLTENKRRRSAWWRSELSGASRLDQDIMLSPDPQDAEIEDITEGSTRKRSRLSSPSSITFRSAKWDDDQEELGASQPVSEEDEDKQSKQSQYINETPVAWSANSTLKHGWDMSENSGKSIDTGSPQKTKTTNPEPLLEECPRTPDNRKGFMLQSDKEVQDNMRKTRIATTLPEPHPEPQRRCEDTPSAAEKSPIAANSPQGAHKLSVSPMARLVDNSSELLIASSKNASQHPISPIIGGSPGHRSISNRSPGHRSPQHYEAPEVNISSPPVIYSPGRTVINVSEDSPRFAASPSPREISGDVPHFGLAKNQKRSPQWQSTGSPAEKQNRLVPPAPPPLKKRGKSKSGPFETNVSFVRKSAAAVKSARQTPKGVSGPKVVIDGRDGARFSFGADDNSKQPSSSADWDSGGEAFNDDPALLFSRPLMSEKAGVDKPNKLSHDSTPTTPKPIPAASQLFTNSLRRYEKVNSESINIMDTRLEKSCELPVVDSPILLNESASSPMLLYHSPDAEDSPKSTKSPGASQSSARKSATIFTEPTEIIPIRPTSPAHASDSGSGAIVVHKSAESFEARKKSARDAARKRAAPRRRIVAEYGPESAPLTYFPVNQIPAAFMMNSESQRKSIALLGAELGKYPRRTRQKPLRWWMNEAYVFERPKDSQCAIVVGVRRRPIGDDHVVLHPSGSNGQYLKIIDLTLNALPSTESPLPELPSSSSRALELPAPASNDEESSTHQKPTRKSGSSTRMSNATGSKLALAKGGGSTRSDSQTKTAPKSKAASKSSSKKTVAKKRGNKQKATQSETEAASSNLKVIRREDIGFVPVTAGSDTFNVAIVLETPQVTLCEIVFGPRRDKGRDIATSDITGEVIWGEASCCLLAIGEATSKISFADESLAVDELANKAKQATEKTATLHHNGKQSAAYKLSRGSWFLIPKGTSYNLFNLSKTSQLVLALNVEIMG